MKLLLSMNLPYLRLNGANKGNRILAEALSAQGHPFRVIVPSFSPTDQLTRSSFQAMLQSREIPFRAEDHKDVFTLNGVEVHSIADPAQLRAELVTELERDEPDFVFISTEDPTQNLLDAALRICPSKVVYIVHTLEFLPFGPHAFFPSQARARLIGQTAGMISVSQFVQQYIKEWSGLDSLQLYWPAYGEPPFPHLGSFDNPFVTHINPCAVKGISILLGLADTLPQVQFAAVPTWGATQEDRAALAQRANISLLTPTEHIDELFRHTKVLLVPSLWFEGLGFVTLEAMLRGVPVIAASSGGIPEAKLGTDFVIPVHPIERFTDQLDEHHLPIPIVPTQDLAPWRAALEKLLSDRDFYQQHAADARSRAIEFVSRLSFEPLVAYLHHLASRPKALAATTTVDPSAVSSQDRGNPALSAANLTPEQRALLLQRLRKKNQTQAATSAEPPVGIQPVPRTHPLPLSFAQQRLWFLDQLEPGSAAYNLPGGFRVRLPVNTAILHQSILEIIRRHEVLRTTFQVIDGEPVQVINPEPACLFSVSDVSHLADRPDGRQLLAAHVIEETQSSFDLATGPLVRVKVLKLGAQDWVIVVTMHHIVSDGWSVGVFLREIQTLYAAFSQGKPSPLPPLPIQYADFAIWQREKLSGPALETQLTFWRQQLGDTTGVLELPTDHLRPVHPSHRGGWEQATLAPHLVEPLRRLSQSEGCTMFMTLLGAFAVQLSRYTGQHDILIGTPIANRTRSEVENLIGFFVNTLVIRVNLSGKPGFRDVLRQVRETALGAFAHQDVPFEKLVELLHPDRDLNRTPLFQVMFAFGQEGRASQKSTSPNRTQLIDTLEVENRTSKFDLTLSMAETEAGIIAGFEYKTELFESATIRRFLTHLETLLHGVCANPEALVSSLPLMPESERDQILVQPNQTERPFPTNELLHQLIETQAQQTPDVIAVVFGDQHLTYHQLNSQASVLAQYLQHVGVGPGALVGVLIERSIEMVTALLGVLKAGGAYVPLDPGYPAERLAFMIGDAQVSLILTQSHLVERLPHTSAQTICLDQPFSVPAIPNNTIPAAQPVPEDLAYVLYTSGSTGQPKGVMIPHRAICNHMHWMHETFPLSADDRVLQKTPFSFDASVWEFWAPLMAGAQLVMAEPGIHQDAESLSQAIANQQITILQVVPTLLSLLLEEPLFSQCSQLRRVFAGGEALSGNLRDRFFEKLPAVELVNLYGPTECTIDATFYVCQPDDSSRTVPIGKPVSNMTALVLDADGHPVPIGIPGELYLGGAGVGCGYLRRPELTQERFKAGFRVQGSGFRDSEPEMVDQATDQQFETSRKNFADESRFISAKPGTRNPEPGTLIWYRTGDRVRWLPDGNLEFLGRVDTQVKLRGYRIETDEIEAVLQRHPLVREAVVVVRQDSADDQRLVAYVTLSADDSRPEMAHPAQLVAFLQPHLPEFMLPSAVVILPELPRLPNGKTDRRALPAPDQSVFGTDRSVDLPRTPIEEMLIELWKQVLKVEAIGIHDNFFALGGHSLLATQLITRLRKTFEVELPLKRIFEAQTVAQLAAIITQAQAQSIQLATGQPRPQLVAVSRNRPLPLSFAQERLWFLDQLKPGSPLYNIPLVFGLPETVNLPELEQAFTEMIRRHEILRTTFPSFEGEPVQMIGSPVDFHFEEHFIPGSETTDEEQITAFLRQPFNLERGPLLRGAVFQRATQKTMVAVSVHHIVFDGWSSGVLFRELAQIYRALHQRQSPGLPELPIQYADYAVWQRNWFQGAVFESELAFWKNQLAGIPPLLELPTDRPRPVVRSFQGARQFFEFDESATEKLKTLSRQENVTLFMVLLTAYVVLLARYSGQNDISVGTPVANRTQTETEALIGFFVNTLVIRTQLEAEPTFLEVLRQVKQTVLDVFAHQEMPFEKLVEVLQPERNLSHTPLFQAFFVFQAASPAEFKPFGESVPVSLRSAQPQPAAADQRVAPGMAKFDLTLSIFEKGAKLSGALEYSTDLFDHDTMRRMIGHFQTLVSEIIAQADRSIRRLPLLTQPELDQQLIEWNETTRPYPIDRCLQVLFMEQVTQTPDAIAVQFGDLGDQLLSPPTLTFRQLNDRAEHLAQLLRAAGVGPDVLVGLCIERSLEMVVAVLGILKAGGAYVPMEPGYPLERLQFMVEDTQMPVVLVLSKDAHRFAETTATILCLDALPEFIQVEPVEEKPVTQPATSLAYVLYTSGTTGKPKGVQIEHRQIVNYVFGVSERVGFDPGMSYAMVQPLTVDSCKTVLFPPLLFGGCLHVITKELSLNPEALSQYFDHHHIDVLKIAPSHLAALQIPPFTQKLLPRKRLVVGGEGSTWDWIHSFDELSDPACLFFNHYGPTETTVGVLTNPIQKGRREHSSPNLPLGKPLPNCTMFILDQFLQPVPVGVVGELFIGGDCVARGYLNRPELTAERFALGDRGQGTGDSLTPGDRGQGIGDSPIPVLSPFIYPPSSIPHPLYRAGDLARYRPDGTIEFLGRNDLQVKIRGFRIELGEIQAVLNQHPVVRESIVLARTDQQGNKRLVAYCTLHPDQQGAQVQPAILHFLADHLPDFMVPSALMIIDALPLSAHGKIDPKRLPEPEFGDPSHAQTYVPARDAIEALLVRLWEETLGMSPIGVTDNFFHLGGHSLLAVRLITRIQQLTRRNLSVATLFQKATIEHLAQVLRESQPTRVTSLVPLQPRGHRPPVICFHALSGTVAPFVQFSRLLGPDQPVYGLQSRGIDFVSTPLEDIPGMAAAYLADLKEVQPTGPYQLCGWSMGGLIAYEVAQQLTRQGEAVAQLILIDVEVPTPEPEPVVENAVLLASLVDPLLGVTPDDLRSLDLDQQLAFVLERKQTSPDLQGLLGLEHARRVFQVVKLNSIAARKYECNPYSGNVIVLRSEEHGPDEPLDLGWGRLVQGGLEIVQVRGTHQRLLREPFVEKVAEVVQTKLSATED